MNQSMINDKPSKALFFFAIPMVLGNIFQQLYQIVDSLVVGNAIGSEALAAVGTSGPIVFLFISCSTGISLGSGVVISQLFGSKQIEKMKSAMYTILFSVIGLSVILAVVGVLMNALILRALDVPDEIFKDANTYLQIYFLSLPFVFLYNILNAIFNALGDSKIPLYFLMGSSLLNVGLDVLFVYGFRFGVAGVAWATLIAQGIAALLSGVVLRKKLHLYTANKKEIVYFDVNLLAQMCKIAIPSMIQQSVVSLGMLLIQALVNGYGSDFIAGYTAATKIDGVAIMPMINIGNAVSTFTAQNIGARKVERIKEGYHAGVMMMISIYAVTVLAVFLFGEVFIRGFMNETTSAVAIDTGVTYLRVVSVFYFVFGVLNLVNSVLRGAGDMIYFMVVTFTGFLTRIILAYTFADMFGKEIIWWSIPIGWLLGFTIAYIRYRTGKWKERVLV